MITSQHFLNVVDISVSAKYLGYLFFFFQAEDGIRDLVRSRGLGDVYKRQILLRRVLKPKLIATYFGVVASSILVIGFLFNFIPVSYTHLTLPTSDLV